MLMMLAFLVDQTQQLCCPLFQAVLAKLKYKKTFWHRIRSIFDCESMEIIYKALLWGFKVNKPIILDDSA